MSSHILQMKDMPLSERPYEKCQHDGASALTDAELLAVIIKTGTKNLRSIDLAMQVIKLGQERGGLGALNYLSMKDLQKIKGIGKVKAIQILCAAELSKRIAKCTAAEKISFNKPESIALFYMEEMRYLPQEHLRLIMLDTKNRLIKEALMSKGTVNATLMHPREIFIEALKNEAVSIILIHNHPSGDPAPSREDIQMTKAMAEAGSLIGIHLLDHIIIGDNCYQSLAGCI